jgi:hypothetical protein
MFHFFFRILGQVLSGSSHTNFWLLYFFKALNILFFGKILVLIGRISVSMILKVFGLSLQIPSGSSHTNFWLLCLFSGTKHTFFGKNFVRIGRFGVLIIFLGFGVEPANSVG